MGAELSTPPSPLTKVKNVLTAQCGDSDEKSATLGPEFVELAQATMDDAVDMEEDVELRRLMYPEPACAAVESVYQGDGVHSLRWPHGATYVGHLVLMEGHGSIHHVGPHVDICEHPVRAGAGKMDGYGKWTAPDGKSSYDGEWKEDLWHGHGIHSCELGMYEGQFERGVCHGKGRMVFSKGMSGVRHPCVYRSMPVADSTAGPRGASEAPDIHAYGRYIEGEWQHGLLQQPHETRGCLLPTC